MYNIILHKFVCTWKGIPVAIYTYGFYYIPRVQIMVAYMRNQVYYNGGYNCIAWRIKHIYFF